MPLPGHRGRRRPTSLAAEVARLRQVQARLEGPAIVAGHSYGGQIITALGADAPNVASVLRGYMACYAVPGNAKAIRAFRDQVTRHWHPHPPDGGR